METPFFFSCGVGLWARSLREEAASYWIRWSQPVVNVSRGLVLFTLNNINDVASLSVKLDRLLSLEVRC